MKPPTLRIWYLSGSILFLELGLLAFQPTAAQIIPDNTLPVNSIVTPQGNIRVIEKGTRLGNNLFHSFQEFSFSVLTGDTTGDTAFFNNDFAVKNILTRITGGLPSNIDGLIQVNGEANLFFINPNGIIFGANASLQIGGSFVASTANSLKFADGSEFSATTPQTSPLLTISVPMGVQFGSNPGGIVNRSQASPNGAVNTYGLPVGLQVESGKTLALVGGNVSLEGGNITAADGRIELGSVAEPGLVRLSELTTGYTLDYTDLQNFRDIQLTQGAVVDASGEGGGNIQLLGRNIILSDDSLVSSLTLGAKTGGILAINATESVNLSGDNTILSTGTLSTGNAVTLTIFTKRLKLEGGALIASFTDGEGRAGDMVVSASDSIELIGTSSDGQFSTALGSQVCALSTNCESVTGNGGNLMLETKRLLIRDGARMDASTFGAGQGGDVLVIASDSVEVIGANPDGQITSGIFTQVAKDAIPNAGDAGNLTIATRQLTILDGGQVSTATFTGGKGGALTIKDSDSIRLSGFSPAANSTRLRSGIFVSAEPGSTGNVGELNISSRQLTVENGAEISANNSGTGKGGTVILNTRQLIIRDGGWVGAGSRGEGAGGTLTVNATESVEVTGSGTVGSDTVVSSLFTEANASGKAGDLNITTNNLNVQDGAQISVSGQGSGPAGNMTIDANTIFLNQGRLRAETQAGSGANITFQNLDLLLMRHQSPISAQAFNDANGGDITIQADNGFIVAVPNENSDIIANAFQGNGGNIQITVEGIYGLEFRPQLTPLSDINASSQFGVNGIVQIITPGVDISRGLGELPTNLVDATSLIDRRCTDRADSSQRSSFTITGRGGLPPGPYDVLQNESVIVNWVTDQPVSDHPKQNNPPVDPNQSTAPQTPRLIEAQGWVYGPNGEVILTAEAPNVTPNNPTLTPATCPDF